MERSYGVDDWPALAPGPSGAISARSTVVPYATLVNVPESKDSVVLGARYGDALTELYRLWVGLDPGRSSSNNRTKLP